MTIVARKYSFVIGVDTHAATHTLAVLVAATGERLDVRTFPSSASGIARAIEWVGRRTGGDATTLVVVEGIGSYGAGLAAAADHAGYDVREAAPTPTSLRAGSGKSDPIDAELIARTVLGLDEDRLRRPRAAEGIRVALRILLAARDQLSRDRTRAVNMLTALIRTVPGLGIAAPRRLTRAQIATIGRWRPHPTDPIEIAIARREAIRLALRVHHVNTELKTNTRALTDLVQQHEHASLTAKTGIGPVNAAIILTTWSHTDRVRSDSAFAMLAGTAPIPASSGNTTRHRLSRNGDRRLNRAVHVIALTRMAHDPATRAYVARRLTEGRTRKDIHRILKRYITREIYRHLNTP